MSGVAHKFVLFSEVRSGYYPKLVRILGISGLLELSRARALGFLMMDLLELAMAMKIEDFEEFYDVSHPV